MCEHVCSAASWDIVKAFKVVSPVLERIER